MGLAYSPLALIVLREAAADIQGAATSALSLLDSVGTALGTGLTGALVAASIRSTGEPGTGLAVAFALAVSVGLGGVALSSRLRPRTVVVAGIPHRASATPAGPSRTPRP
jgi:ABC-type nitrate/sulfonate/bicarbonate transport system permease component